jgi:hypothetical protein
MAGARSRTSSAGSVRYRGRVLAARLRLDFRAGRREGKAEPSGLVRIKTLGEAEWGPRPGSPAPARGAVDHEQGEDIADLHSAIRVVAVKEVGRLRARRHRLRGLGRPVLEYDDAVRVRLLYRRARPRIAGTNPVPDHPNEAPFEVEVADDLPRERREGQRAAGEAVRFVGDEVAEQITQELVQVAAHEHRALVGYASELHPLGHRCDP